MSPYRLLTLVFGTTLLKPRCMHEADSSGCPPKVPGSTISFLEFTPTRLKGDFTNQNMLDWTRYAQIATIFRVELNSNKIYHLTKYINIKIANTMISNILKISGSKRMSFIGK